MKNAALFQGEIIMKQRKYIDKIKKIFFSRTTEPISTKRCTKHPWVQGNQVCSNEGPHPFQRGDNYEIVKNTLTKLKNLLLQNHWANFNQTWHKASLCEWDLICSKKKHLIFIKIIMGFFLLLINVMILSYVFIDLNCFSQVSDVAHGPLVSNGDNNEIESI